MITPSFSLTATERVLPRMALDFTTASLDSRVTFTRSGNTATVVNSSGYVVGINADLPRFDYDPVTLACKGLLIEEARTNLVLQSQDFSTTWFNNSTVTTDTTVSPSNVQDADTLNATVADQVTQQTVTVANDTVTRTFSVFLKQGTAAITTLRLLYQGGTQTSAQISITWSTKVVTNDFSTVGLVFGAENYGNGWYRVYLAFANNGLANTNAVCRILPAGAPGVGGTTGTVFAWGAQYEVGAFPTSYIPTVAASVTRNADVATMTGTNFSDWYNQTQNSVTAEFTTNALNSSLPFVAQVDNGSATSTNRWSIYRDSNGQFIIWRIIAGSASSLSSGVVVTSGVSAKAAAAVIDGSNGIAVDGNATTTVTVGLPAGTMTTLRIGARSSDFFLNGVLAKLAFYSQRITNAEIQAFSK